MAFTRFSAMAPDVKTTHKLAAVLARQARSGDCILLRGNLGAGKTTFARGFIQELYPNEKRVLSPTFSLVQIYTGAGLPTVWHFDLYRLHSEQEALEIGLEDALFSGITLIEWPVLVESILPGTVLDVTIAMSNRSGQRNLTFVGPPVWQRRLDAIKQELESVA